MEGFFMDFFKAKEMYMDFKIMEGITVKTQKRYDLYFKQVMNYFGTETDVDTIIASMVHFIQVVHSSLLSTKLLRL